jgi:hypothetical protein
MKELTLVAKAVLALAVHGTIALTLSINPGWGEVTCPTPLLHSSRLYSAIPPGFQPP